MTKVAAGPLLLSLAVENRDAQQPRYRVLYQRIRDLILDGTLGPGARLPSTRTLAHELSVARNTVLAAIEQLMAEGYLVARVGAGTFVAPRVPDEHAVGAPRPTETDVETPAPRLSARGAAIARTRLGLDAMAPGPFALGIPALDAFPHRNWNRLVAKHARAQDASTIGYGDPAGHLPLRQAIATYLRTARGVDADAEQVIIVSSSQQALDMACRLVLDPGDDAWIEEPGYLGARGALVSAGANLVPIPVDGDGLDVERGRDQCMGARLAIVTPSHQYPTGATLSLPRRLALLDWAREHDAWIVEDDYDSEFRFRGRPLAALQGLDSSGRVLYVGTFTKVMYPALRVAYLVAPPPLVAPLIAARTFVDRHTPRFPQAVLAEWMETGQFTSHIRRMRRLYRQRQTLMVDALANAVGDALRPRPDDAGMHLVADLDPSLGVDESALVAAGRDRGLDIATLSRYALETPQPPALLLGYTSFDEATIADGVARLASAIKALTTSYRTRRT